MAEKSEELKLADAALDAAVEEISRAYGSRNGNRPGIVTDFIVVYATTAFDEEGDKTTSIGISWPTDGRTAFHHGIGLLEYAKARITSEINYREADDD
ncbi:MAG: hypothetical protein WB777_14205 [Mycobacterium sp.]